jgi:hypothetical protein
MEARRKAEEEERKRQEEEDKKAAAAIQVSFLETSLHSDHEMIWDCV